MYEWTKRINLEDNFISVCSKNNVLFILRQFSIILDRQWMTFWPTFNFCLIFQLTLTDGDGSNDETIFYASAPTSSRFEPAYFLTQQSKLESCQSQIQILSFPRWSEHDYVDHRNIFFHEDARNETRCRLDELSEMNAVFLKVSRVCIHEKWPKRNLK